MAQGDEDNILNKHVVPFFGYYHDVTMIQQDNTWPRMARIMQHFLREQNIKALE